MANNKVTPIREVDDRFVSRSGVLQPNVSEARRKFEAEAEPSRGRETLNDLENELAMLRSREADREHAVTTLRPLVNAGEEKVRRMRLDLKNADEAVAERLGGARQLQNECQIKLKMAEDSLAAYKCRLDTSTKILAAVKTLQLEWYRENGATLTKLRKLTGRIHQ